MSSFARYRSTPELTFAVRVLVSLLILALVSTFFVVIPAGHRGVWLEWGQVKPKVLPEGIHWIVPGVQRVEIMSVRVQKQELNTEASSKDLQDVYIDLVLNWHPQPKNCHLIFQTVGSLNQILERVINPSLEESLKAAIARYTAEEVITLRNQVKADIELNLKERLEKYYLNLDDLALVETRFSEQFRNAVEAKQVAEQEAKKAEYIARKAEKKAQARINLAKGEAEAHRILQSTLTPEILKNKMIERWNGKLPPTFGGSSSTIFDLQKF
ncbi:MAG: prohibitin family protein [Cyanobacteriota bacterium]|jgi:regulator of protease activity HflC (stomatin/prohibitin superfamily)